MGDTPTHGLVVTIQWLDFQLFSLFTAPLAGHAADHAKHNGKSHNQRDDLSEKLGILLDELHDVGVYASHRTRKVQSLYRDTPVLTLRQIDQMNAVAKGTAFRAFKQAELELIEGEDYFVIAIATPPDPAAAALLEKLRAMDALYASSQVAILITEKAYARMQAVANLSRQ